MTSERRRSANRLSLAHLTALELSPPDLVTAAHAAGFDAVGIRVYPGFAEDPQHAMIGPTELAHETRRRLGDTGMQVQDVEILRLKPSMDFGVVEAIVEIGAWLGARAVLVLGNDPEELRATESFGRVCELAGRHGLDAALEFVAFNDVKSLEQAHRMVDAVRQPNAKLLVDSLHFFRAGQRPEQLAEIDPSRFTYVQWCDAPALGPPFAKLQIESRCARAFPGEGELPLFDLLDRLPPDITLAVEAPNAALATSTPGAERVRMAGQAIRRFLINYDQRRCADAQADNP